MLQTQNCLQSRLSSKLNKMLSGVTQSLVLMALPSSLCRVRKQFLKSSLHLFYEKLKSTEYMQWKPQGLKNCCSVSVRKSMQTIYKNVSSDCSVTWEIQLFGSNDSQTFYQFCSWFLIFLLLTSAPMRPINPAHNWWSIFSVDLATQCKVPP